MDRREWIPLVIVLLLLAALIAFSLLRDPVIESIHVHLP
jgi:hypothetical protein